MLSFLHKAQRDISRSDRRQFMEDWFLALFKDSLVYKHLATTPAFQAQWNAHDYCACYDLLFQAHLNRVAALLRVCNYEGAQFVRVEAEVLSDVTQRSLVNARNQLIRYYQSTVGKQGAAPQQSLGVYDGNMKLKHSLIAYDWIMQTYSTLQSRNPIPMCFFYYTTQVMDHDLDTSGLIHDAGTLYLKAGHSLEGPLSRWDKVAFRHVLKNCSPEPLRALIPFYKLYPGLLQAAVAELGSIVVDAFILTANVERVALLLDCLPINKLKELLQMSQSLLNQGEQGQGAARVKLIYRAYAEYDEPLPNSLQKNTQAWAIWGEVLRERIMPAASMSPAI